MYYRCFKDDDMPYNFNVSDVNLMESEPRTGFPLRIHFCAAKKTSTS